MRKALLTTRSQRGTILSRREWLRWVAVSQVIYEHVFLRCQIEALLSTLGNDDDLLCY